jgi:uncharacterized protein (DUF433 family)
MFSAPQSRVSIDPKVCHGKPVIRGTRVLISNILGAMAAGQSHAEILEDYPALTKDDIDAALEFASQMAQFESFSPQTKIFSIPCLGFIPGIAEQLLSR